MLTLFSTTWRLQAIGLPSTENHHDLTNACMSVSHEQFDVTTDTIFDREQVHLVERLYKKALLVLRLCDGVVMAVQQVEG